MSRLPAPVPSLTAVLSWGAMLPIADHVLRHGVDAFNLTAIRYGAASVLLLAILAAVEGRGALRLEGRARELFLLGTIGFAGFNLLTYLGLEHTEPQNAALIVATMPLVTMLARWQGDGIRPPRAQLALAGAALAGVALVITRGDLHATLGSGDLMVLAGVVGWVVYTRGAARFPGHSPLRYTALSAALGTISILALTAATDVAGLQDVPAAADVAAQWPAVSFVVVFGAVLAVVGWNTGVRRLGAPNAALFMNLVPVTAFAIRIGGGYEPVAAELVGATLTVSALVAANVLARAPQPAAAGAVQVATR